MSPNDAYQPGSVAPRCAACGYNLTGLTSNRCPECGRLFIEAGVIVPGRTTAARPPRRVIMWIAAGALAGVLLLFGTALVMRAQAFAAQQQAIAAQQRAQAAETAAFARQVLASSPKSDTVGQNQEAER